MAKVGFLALLLLTGCGSNLNQTSPLPSQGSTSGAASRVAERALTPSAQVYLSRATQGESQLGRRPLGGNRYLVFHSSRALIGPDTNSFSDIYLRDLRTGHLSLVSQSASGQLGNGNSSQASISAEGRYVVFTSAANNLVANDRNAQPDIFRKDLRTGQVQRVNLGVGGLEANRPSQGPVVSREGRWVAFSSLAGNLVAGDSNGASDIFVRDLQQNTTHWISQGLAGSCWEVDLTPDGATLAFAQQLSPEERQILRCQRSDPGQRQMVSRNAAGQAADDQCYGPSLSDDGQKVAFYSLARNLVTQPLEGNFFNCFLQDQAAQSIRCLSLNPGGGQANGHSGLVFLAGDGFSASFASEASDLVAGDTNQTSDVFRWSFASGVVRASRTTLGGQANGHSRQSALGRDGRLLAFASHSNNLVASDKDYQFDIFLHDGHFSRTSLASPVCRRPGLPFAGWEGARGQAPPQAVMLSGSFVQADLDRDGDLDLASANRQRIEVSLNQGLGVFGQPLGFGLGSQPDHLSSGDLDGDGDTDLIACSSERKSLSLWLNDGSGGFTRHSEIQLGRRPGGAVAADWDHDGDVDLSVTVGDGINGSLVLLGNRGGMQFSQRAQMAVHSWSQAPVASDLDRDGDLDLIAIQTGDDSLKIFWNSGRGVFFAQTTRLATSRSPQTVVVGDVDGDGHLDLVSGDSSPLGCSFFFGNGRGSFSQPEVSPSLQDLGYPSITDLDGDGRQEVLVVTYQYFPQILSILPGRSISRVGGFYGGLGTPVALGDVNGDSRPDITASHEFGLGIHLNQGGLRFSEASNLGTLSHPQSPVVGDLDGDGQTDVACASRSRPQEILRFVQTSLALWSGPSASSTPADPRFSLSHDLDQDGDLDLVGTDYGRQNLTVRINDGLGDFHSLAPLALAQFSYPPVAGDLDGDGDQDVLLGTRGAVLLCLNDGQGRLAAPLRLELAGSPNYPVLADLDGDSDLDIAVADRDSQVVHLLLNQGGSSFQAQQFNTSLRGHKLAAGDMDQDGDQDLCLTASTASAPFEGAVAILLNDGQAGLSQLPSRPAYLSEQSPLLGDIDSDGDLDLLVSVQLWSSERPESSLMALYLNQGQGQLASAQAFGGLGQDAKLLDMDNDGDLDLVGITEGLGWLKNLTRP